MTETAGVLPPKPLTKGDMFGDMRIDRHFRGLKPEDITLLNEFIEAIKMESLTKDQIRQGIKAHPTEKFYILGIFSSPFLKN